MRVAAVALLACAFHCEKNAVPKTATPTLSVPKLTAPLTFDGELGEPPWQIAARTGAFLDETQRGARPFSSAQFLWDEQNLYLGLYAADQDIRPDDFFHVVINGKVFDFYANGTVKGGAVHAAVDKDGTYDDPKDDDEEWVIEAAVPWALIGGKTGAVDIAISRCDTPKNSAQRCGAYASAAHPARLTFAD